jgi:hypothetical protein
VRECEDVVLYFTNYLGYLAREVISRHELEELIDRGIDPDELAGEIASRIDENMTIFRRIFEGATGTRMEEILRQSLYALMEVEGFTLLDIPKFLDRNDSTFRDQVVKDLKNEDGIHFFI